MVWLSEKAYSMGREKSFFIMLWGNYKMIQSWIVKWRNSKTIYLNIWAEIGMYGRVAYKTRVHDHIMWSYSAQDHHTMTISWYIINILLYTIIKRNCLSLCVYTRWLLYWYTITNFYRQSCTIGTGSHGSIHDHQLSVHGHMEWSCKPTRSLPWVWT